MVDPHSRSILFCTVIGNSLATAVVAKWEGELAPEHELGPDDVVPPDMVPGEVPGMQAGHA